MNARDDQPNQRPPGPEATEHEIESTRVSRAWLAVAVALVLLLLGAIFIAQNGADVEMEFLWFDWTAPIGIALLFAAITGALVVLLLGIARIVQLRRLATRHRHDDERSKTVDDGRAEEPREPGPS